MTVVLEKVSLPNAWRKEYACLADAVDALRSLQCRACMEGDEYHEPLDFDMPDGGRYACRDAELLLSTGCGLEYALSGDHGLWPTPEDLDPEMGRHSRRKTNDAQLLHEWLPASTGAVVHWASL